MKRTQKVILIAILEILLLAPMLLPVYVDHNNRTVDDYWAATDLQANEFESMLNQKICTSDRLSYLACANAVIQMAERFNLVVEPSGVLRPMGREDIQQHLSESLNEKIQLDPWIQNWKNHRQGSSRSFLKVWHELDQKYVSRHQRTGVIATGMNGYLSIAKDPHSYIVPLDFYEDMIARSDSKQTNLGFIARRVKGYALVRKVFEQSPAEKSGLRTGDRILRINGNPIGDMLPNQFADLMKLKQGDRLAIEIERWNAGQRQQKYLEIVKSDYVTPNVTISILSTMSALPTLRANLQIQDQSAKFALLTINKFAKDTCLETENQLIHLRENNVRGGVILDLRDNPGGQVEEAACVLNLFLPKGTPLFETRYFNPNHNVDRYRAQKKPIYRGTLAVLINSGSASAAEIVAGVLKDLGRATLVGERSFGKGTFQDGRLWGAHTKIAVFETQGMYYFPSGWTPQLVGIEPDIKVEFSDAPAHREEELFFNPIIPKDLWTGPQSLTWIQLMQCQDSMALWKDLGEHSGDDAQVVKAREWLRCQSNSVAARTSHLGASH